MTCICAAWTSLTGGHETMTDLEMTRLCAEAMGYRGEGISDHWGGLPIFASEIGAYDPLHDDAQAMALVKQFGLQLHQRFDGTWLVTWRPLEAERKSLNRAIVECVAEMQAKLKEIENVP